MKRKREYTTRVSKQGVLDTLSMKPVNGLYLLHCCLTTTYLPKTSSYFKLFAYTLKYNLIRQTIRPPFIKYPSNVNRKTLKSFLCDFRVSKSIRKIFKPRRNEARAQRGTERDLNLLKKLFPANKRLSREFES